MLLLLPPPKNRPDHGYPSWYGQAVYNASVDGICQETCRWGRPNVICSVPVLVFSTER